jgi:hypothetical protein
MTESSRKPKQHIAIVGGGAAGMVRLHAMYKHIQFYFLKHSPPMPQFKPY